MQNIYSFLTENHTRAVYSLFMWQSKIQLNLIYIYERGLGFHLQKAKAFIGLAAAYSTSILGKRNASLRQCDTVCHSSLYTRLSRTVCTVQLNHVLGEVVMEILFTTPRLHFQVCMLIFSSVKIHVLGVRIQSTLERDLH